jgi:hypothetical protein
MPLAHLPIPNISVSQHFVVSRPIEPDMSSKTTLKIIFPVTFVLLLTSLPFHDTLAVSFIVSPLTFVKVTACVSHFPVSPLHSPLPLAIVDGAILIVKHSVSVSHSIDPLPFIFNTFFRVDILAVTMSQTISHLTFIRRSIWPRVTT